MLELHGDTREELIRQGEQNVLGSQNMQSQIKSAGRAGFESGMADNNASSAAAYQSGANDTANKIMQEIDGAGLGPVNGPEENPNPQQQSKQDTIIEIADMMLASQQGNPEAQAALKDASKQLGSSPAGDEILQLASEMANQELEADDISKMIVASEQGDANAQTALQETRTRLEQSTVGMQTLELASQRAMEELSSGPAGLAVQEPGQMSQ